MRPAVFLWKCAFLTWNRTSLFWSWHNSARWYHAGQYSYDHVTISVQLQCELWILNFWVNVEPAWDKMIIESIALNCLQSTVSSSDLTGHFAVLRIYSQHAISLEFEISINLDADWFSNSRNLNLHHFNYQKPNP